MVSESSTCDRTEKCPLRRCLKTMSRDWARDMSRSVQPPLISEVIELVDKTLDAFSTILAQNKKKRFLAPFPHQRREGASPIADGSVE